MDKFAYKVKGLPSSGPYTVVSEDNLTSGFGGMIWTPTGNLFLTGANRDYDNYIKGDEAKGIHHYVQELLRIYPDRREIDLDPDFVYKQHRTPNPGKGTGSYTNVHGDYSFQGDKRKAQKVFRALLGAKVIEPDYLLVGSPEWRGVTVGEAVGLKPIDPVDEFAGKSFGAVTLYHGTSKKRWETIKVKGLRPGSPTGIEPKDYADYQQGYTNHNVYLASSQTVAENFATRAAALDRSLAVVLEVTIRDFGKLMLDEDNAGALGSDDPRDPDRIPFYQLEWAKRPDAEAIGRAFQRKMLPGLRSGRTIAYRGVIPPRDLKVSYMYKPVRMKTEPSNAEFESAMNKTRGTVVSPIRVALRYLLA